LLSTRISQNVYLIDTLAVGQRNTVAVYVLKGDKTALVDSGYASSHATVLQGLVELGLRPSDIDYLIPTHVHMDHAGGTGHLLKEMPRAKVLAHHKGVPHLVDPTRLIESATRVFGEELIKSHGHPIGISAERITPVGEEMHLDLGGISISMIHSPGHTRDQLSVFVEEGKVLLPADATGILYPAVRAMIPATAPPSLSPVELVRTTENLAQLAPKLLLAPHFGLRRDAGDVLETTRKKTEEWVDKVRALKKTGARADAIAEAMMKEVALEAGIGEGRLPPYAQLSVRVSVNGIVHYLERNP